MEGQTEGIVFRVIALTGHVDVEQEAIECPGF